MATTAADNFKLALRLASVGFHVFPCHSGGEKAKSPMPFIRWRQVSTCNESKISEWWQKWPTAAIGLDLGKSGLIVVDADRHGEVDGVAAMGEVMSANNYEPHGVPLVATPNEGTHFFYRQIEGQKHGNSSGDLPDGIDIRGDGGYVIAPGTVMEDGRLYEVFGEISDAPVLPDWLAKIIKSEKGDKPASALAPVQITRSTHNDLRVQSYCDEAIAQETDRVRLAAPGQRNNILNEAAFALGQLVGAKWVTRTEIEGLLTNAAITCGLKEVEVAKTIRSGLNSGERDPRKMPDDDYSSEWNPEHAEAARILKEAMDGTLYDANTGEIVENDSEPEVPTIPNEDFPPGLVGEIARWIVATSRRPQPALAIGAALTLVGVVAGRHIMGPTEAGTALYVLGLAPTSSGKDHPLKCIGLIMTQAKLKQHIGPGEFISMTAMINTLKRQPLCLAPMDEFGDFMRRVYARKGSPHERAVTKILRSTWSANFGGFATPEWAGVPSEWLNAPHLSLFGTSTHEQFYTALEGGSVSDGTLNRFLIIDAPHRSKEVEPSLDTHIVPQSIISGLLAIFNLSGEIAAASRNSIDANPAEAGLQTRLPWCPDGSHEVYKNYTKGIDQRMAESPREADFVARAAEMSIRIATVISAGCYHNSVRIDSMNYGIEITERSISKMINGADDYMAENENQANAQRVLRTIKSRKKPIKHSELLRSLQYVMKTRELRDVISMLCETEVIEMIEIQPSGKGRPSQAYKYLPR